MSPWLAVSLSAWLVLRQGGIQLTPALGTFLTFRYEDVEDALFAIWASASMPLFWQSFLQEVGFILDATPYAPQVMCQLPGQAAVATLAIMLEESRAGHREANDDRMWKYVRQFQFRRLQTDLAQLCDAANKRS